MNKQEVESTYGVSLTDTQWETILWELGNKKFLEKESDVIEKVLLDLNWHEEDYLYYLYTLAKEA